MEDTQTIDMDIINDLCRSGFFKTEQKILSLPATQENLWLPKLSFLFFLSILLNSLILLETFNLKMQSLFLMTTFIISKFLSLSSSIPRSFLTVSVTQTQHGWKIQVSLILFVWLWKKTYFREPAYTVVTSASSANFDFMADQPRYSVNKNK